MKTQYKKIFFIAAIAGLVIGIVSARLTFHSEICDAKSGVGNSFFTDCIIGGTNDGGHLKLTVNLFNRILVFSAISVAITMLLASLYYLVDRKKI